MFCDIESLIEYTYTYINLYILKLGCYNTGNWYEKLKFNQVSKLGKSLISSPLFNAVML